MAGKTKLGNRVWSVIEPFLPKVGGRGGREGKPGKPNRLMFEAIHFKMRTGVPWRDLPPHCGPWESVYTRFRRWRDAGVFERLVNELRDQAEPDLEWMMLDSTIVRAHQDATGAQKKTARKPSASPGAA